ncbi:HNH endonuclease [Blastomonas sp.]|uniref:HNH endonuclease n=1 Tax=Blastomonas sp. TaxID=1909299 RepID=UPI003593B56D
MQSKKWSEEETILALYLYFQLPFGQLHSGNVEIQRLADRIGRTHSSVAMKLANFASLDPKITDSGRRGLGGASKQDREVFARFQKDWTSLVVEAERLMQSDHNESGLPLVKETITDFEWTRGNGLTSVQRFSDQRLGQGFFRRAVIANFEICCCITGIDDHRLLNASHIVPWRSDVGNRHNPANGLSLSATFDRAFDRGLLTVSTDGLVKISRQLLDSSRAETRSYFSPYQGKKIKMGSRFDPDPSLLAWHNKEQFVDA